MSKVVRFWLILLATFICISPTIALAEVTASSPAARVLITELQTEGPTIPSVLTEEFVELTNVSAQVVDISGWELQTKSTGATSAWTKLISLTGQLYPGGSILLSHSGYLDTLAAAQFGSSLSSTAGHLRLVTAAADLIAEDKLGWGGATALDAEAAAAPKPTAAMTLSRKVVDGKYVDTNNNLDDFILAVATPSNNNTEPAEDPVPTDPAVLPTEPDPVVEVPNQEPPPDETVVSPPADEVIDTVPLPTETTTPSTSDASGQTEIPSPVIATVVLPPKVSEIYPDPIAPETDANDEFVELYNPNPTDLPLTGYKLQTGSTFSHSFALDSTVLPAESYVALRSSDTNLVLSNSGGAVRLVTPSGEFIEAIIYADVESGQSFAFANDAWHWTTSLTPNLPNIITLPPVDIPVIKAAVAKIAKTTTPKTTTVKAASTKTTATKASAKTASAKKAVANPERSVFEDPAALAGDPPIHPGVLAGVSALAVLYAGYEYREDVRNRLFKIRGYARARLRHR